MWQGTLQAIFVAPAAGAPMQRVAAAEAVPGRGLRGDRYFEAAGSFSRWPGPHRDLTLIAEEALAALACEAGLPLAPEASRRNLLTRGVPLASLVGATFRVGAVLVKGLRPCQPCAYLERRAALPGLLHALRGRGGLRAHILQPGSLAVGDTILPA